MNSYPSMGSASSIAQFYHQAAAVSAANGVGMDSLGSACSQLSSQALSSVGTGQALSEITRHPWLVPTGEFTIDSFQLNHKRTRLEKELIAF